MDSFVTKSKADVVILGGDINATPKNQDGKIISLKKLKNLPGIE